MNELTLKNNNLTNILTKGGDINSLTFKTIDDKALTEISNWMPEVNRSVTCFNKQNTQTTSSLMTLNMVDATPYRTLRQILAQVEKKRSALNQNIYKIEKNKIKLEQLNEEIENENNELKLKMLVLRRNKMSCDIVDAQTHLEAVLKELGALKRNYEAIIRNNNIPDNWDELDFEEHEIEHHVKSIFRNAIRDRMQGTHNQGTMEYMEQFGINPITAYFLVDQYIGSIKETINDESKAPDITSQYNFYEQMYNLFKDEYKKAMKKLGLDTIIHSDFLMKENK